MSFPPTEIINTWFQDAHTTAVAAGGSVYVMEKHAEREIITHVLKWAYLNMLDELEDLNYPANSRVRVRVTEMLVSLCTADDVDDTEDEEFVDDYNDDEDEDTNKDETTSEEPLIVVDTDLAIEIVGALLKAITSK